MAKNIEATLTDLDSKLRLLVEPVAELAEPVGTTAYALPEADLSRDGGVIKVFEQNLDLKAGFDAKAQIHAADAKIDDPFTANAKIEATSSMSYADLGLGLDIGLKGEPAGTVGSLSISARASAAAGLGYRHLLLVDQANDTRFEAFTELLERTRLPQKVRFDSLEPGEYQQLTAKANLDLGLKLEAGASVKKDLQLTLFDDLSTSATLAANATIDAALGLSLMDRMSYTVGRPSDAPWVRVRIDRARKRSLSFGASFALQVHYDFGTALASLVQNAFDMIPTPRAVETLKEVNQILADGDWDTVKAKISQRGAEVLDDLLEETGWREWLADSEEVTKLTELSRKIVDAYDGLDERIQSLWDDLLGSTGLGKGSEVRKVLDEIVGIDVDNLKVTDLVESEDLKKLLSLIETLSGEDIDEWLLESTEEVRERLKKVQKIAQEAIDFLDNTPKEIFGKLEGFAERTGIAKTVDFLAANATSKKAIENLVSTRIQSLVERFVGKAWDEIDADDLKRVKGWAKKVKKALDAPQELVDKIKKNLEKLDGEIGFSVGLTLERISQRSALLDFDVSLDPDARKLREEIESALVTGKAGEVLITLDEIYGERAEKAEASEKDQELDLPFRLRESVFTHRNVRSRTISVALSIVGRSHARKGVVRRIDESSVRVVEKGKAFERRAKYSGGFERRDELDGSANQTAVWLDHDATGSGLDIFKAYSGKPKPTVRVLYSREDPKTSADEVTQIQGFLTGLGFNARTLDGQIPAGARTRLDVDLRFTGEKQAALTALTGGTETVWNDRFLAAANRFFYDRLIDVRPTAHPTVRRGDIYSVLIGTQDFRDHWLDGSQSFRNWAKTEPAMSFEVDGETVRVRWTEKQTSLANPPINPEYGMLQNLMDKRARGRKWLQEVAKALRATVKTPTPANYEKLSRRFATAGLKSAVYGPTWPSSTFLVWLALELFGANAAELLTGARGLAVVRTKTADAEDWQEPLRMLLPEGGIPRILP